MARPENKGDKVKDALPDPSRNQIDNNLRRLYDDLFEDDIPERFQELLRQLRAQDGDGTGGA